ncbi:MFS transporter [Burkholderia sp. Ac-20379]|uniref:MFS transporter n=1 Tax=Burkholderia sp. Ac-20379 TaxID=2703900 RepID=UPI001F11C1A3|nr:MFS transporter [Burkholderia sp. Ac-20379]
MSSSPRSAASQSDAHHPHRHYSRGLLLLLATIAGVSVANIYYNQPLLGALRNAFPADANWIGVVPTATQLGYAAGMLLLAPLGDRFDRRKLILLQIAGLSVALLVAAAAPALPVLAAASLAIGVLGTIAQQAVPFAAEIAPPAERGAAVGTVMSGLLMGILLARTAAGFVGEYFGWRAVFVASVAALLAVAVAVVLRLPRSTPTSTLRYPQLLASLWHLAVELRGLRYAAATGAAMFGAFSAFWPALTLLLAGAPFHYGPQIAGLFGIVGAAGALAAPYAGKSADKRGPRAVITLSIWLVAVSFGIFAVSVSSLIGLVIGVIVLDVGVQAAQISNQSRIYALKPEARSRVNTVYMVCYFIGGALGSSAGVEAWRLAGWSGVCAVGLAFALLAGAIHHRGARHTD